VLSALVLAGGSRSSVSPHRLAIYYGYPSLVNDARGDLPRAAAAFADYDVVVLGAGLEFAGGGPANAAGALEHAFTARLIERLRTEPRRTAVFGYVPIGSTDRLTDAAVVDRLERWAGMGAAGVLLDEAGFDFGVTRERQNLAVMSAHALGLRVCLNAHDPADVFGEAPTPLNAAGGGNPRGLGPAVAAGDSYLLESFVVRAGVPEPIEALAARARTAADGRRRFGVELFAVATSGEDDVRSLAQYAWWAAAALDVDAFGWGMPSYSAVTSRLPWVPRPPAERTLAGATLRGELVRDGGTWRRETSHGRIVVDTRIRQGGLEPR